MKESVILKINDLLTLEVIGAYSPEEKEVTYYPDGDGYPGMSAYFDIEDVKIVKGNIMDLMIYMSEISDVWYELEKLAIKELEDE